jgi:tRNA (cmo5U34)-methyltransferase
VLLLELGRREDLGRADSLVLASGTLARLPRATLGDLALIGGPELTREESNRFDEAAGTWDEEPRRVEIASAVAAAMRRGVALSADLRVLDFGCGTGLVSLALQPFVGHVTAVDTSEGMLGQLRRKIEAKGLANVETVRLDPAAPRLPDGPFDLVVSSMALHHVEDLAPLFRRFHEVLRPGGGVALADLDREDGTFHEDARGVFHLGFDREAIASLLSEAGFGSVAASTATIARKNDREYPIFLATGRRA